MILLFSFRVILCSPHNLLIANSACQVMWYGGECLDRILGAPVTRKGISCNTVSTGLPLVHQTRGKSVTRIYQTSDHLLMSSEGARANRTDISVLAGLSNHLDLYFKISRKEAAGCKQGLPRAAPGGGGGGGATFPNNRSQSWLHVRIIWETWKRSTPRGWLLAEMLNPIHWAEDVNSSNTLLTPKQRWKGYCNALELRDFYFTYI